MGKHMHAPVKLRLRKVDISATQLASGLMPASASLRVWRGCTLDQQQRRQRRRCCLLLLALHEGRPQRRHASAFVVAAAAACSSISKMAQNKGTQQARRITHVEDTAQTARLKAAFARYTRTCSGGPLEECGLSIEEPKWSDGRLTARRVCAEICRKQTQTLHAGILYAHV